MHGVGHFVEDNESITGHEELALLEIVEKYLARASALSDAFMNLLFVTNDPKCGRMFLQLQDLLMLPADRTCTSGDFVRNCNHSGFGRPICFSDPFLHFLL
ncbi:hypothetical protein Y032_0910g3002 [Ancylostoma ceylanicum]|uniref:Uncharacterized protein n=1 Tax=Ancylostoma ceylanicum TaxID=53326 RepID=A0A016WAJ3_9BILA|nr:hypothetical protein Y032_0910g3002 [Ancylostoma ceylanicum]